MRHHNFTAFDEYIIGAGNAVLTSTELNARLAHFDQLAIMAVVDNIDATGTFTLQIVHSADGRNFTNWNTVADISGTVNTNVNNVFYCSVPNASIQTPLLSYVRFSMMFTTTTRGHVRVTVTQRDQGG
jgi:hypothetical protein